MTRLELLESIPCESTAIEWCIDQGNLNWIDYCERCGSAVNFSLEKQMFRCSKRECGLKIGLRKGTLFENSKLSIRTIVLLLYEWSIQTPGLTASFEYGLSKSTVSKWYQRFRELATFFHVQTSPAAIGGPGITVEIDECLVVKNKYRRGRILAGQQWIFGGVVRGGQECFVEFVSNRSRETLLEIIRRRIMPGSIIATDGWRAYRDLHILLPEMNITHLTVNHSINFVNPDNPEAHTQSIEAFWSVLKRKLRIRGGTNYRNDIDRYFGEHLYCKAFVLHS